VDLSQMHERLNKLSDFSRQHGELLKEQQGHIAVMEKEVEHLDKRLTESETLAKSVFDLSKQIAVFSKDVENLTRTMSVRMDTFEERQTEQGRRIGHIESEPAKKWKMVTEKIMLIVVGAIVGYILIQIGL
jgi:methyl-accepting chemotaxis protein